MKATSVNSALIELTRRVLNSSGISVKGVFLLIVYYIKLILVIPASICQSIFYRGKIKRTIITKQPIFILGHYRSGTTYLHKLLATDTRFGFITYYDILCPNSSLLFGSWLQKLLQFFITNLKIKTAFFNNSIPSLSDPAEEERFLINKGSAYTDYWKFVFPLCWNRWSSCAQQCLDKNYYKQWSNEYLHVLKLATFKHKNKQLILKSPQNTERIKYLLKMFPDAKFIYISRNPYDVYYSMMNLWKRAIKKFCLQEISEEEISGIIFSHYAALSENYEMNKILIPAANLIEIRFDDFETNPLQTLQWIYEKLAIPGFADSFNYFQKQLLKESKYSRYAYSSQNAVLEKIEAHWKKYIDKWNDDSNKTIKNITLVSAGSYTEVQVCDATMPD